MQERKRISADQIEQLVIQIREYTYNGYHGWDFDMDRDEAVALIQKFIEENC